MSINHHEEAILPSSLTVAAQPTLRCAECGGIQCGRARRRGFLEKGLLSWLQFRPVRCRDCGIRFYSWRSRVPSSNSSPRAQVFVSRGNDEFQAIIQQMKEAEGALGRSSH